MGRSGERWIRGSSTQSKCYNRVLRLEKKIFPWILDIGRCFLSWSTRQKSRGVQQFPWRIVKVLLQKQWCAEGGRRWVKSWGPSTPSKSRQKGKQQRRKKIKEGDRRAKEKNSNEGFNQNFEWNNGWFRRSSGDCCSKDDKLRRIMEIIYRKLLKRMVVRDQRQENWIYSSVSSLQENWRYSPEENSQARRTKSREGWRRRIESWRRWVMLSCMLILIF